MKYKQETIDLFWSRVCKTDSCWFYEGPMYNGSNGMYRRFLCDGVSLSTHRFAYELTYGPIPDKMLVRHRCAVLACCNPAHLIVGSHEQNTWDSVARKEFDVPAGVLATYEDFPGWQPKFRRGK